MLKKSTTKLNGNDRYEGFAVELIQRLAERLGFNYTFVMHKDDVYGAFDTKTNTSTGMIREIMIGVRYTYYTYTLYYIYNFQER